MRCARSDRPVDERARRDDEPFAADVALDAAVDLNSAVEGDAAVPGLIAPDDHHRSFLLRRRVARRIDTERLVQASSQHEPHSPDGRSQC